MSLVSLLPLLEGWEDTYYPWVGTVTKNVARVIERKVRFGWLKVITLFTDDSEGAIEVEYNKIKSGWVYPSIAKLYGCDNHAPPPPSSVLRVYNNTGPGSYGIYEIDALFDYYPFKGHTAVDAKLGAGSSFSSATLGVSVDIFEITDVGVFKASLKKLYKELGLSHEGK